jgi:alpha-1,3-mannosyltransferase
MKILHIVRQFYPCIGGVENFVYNLAKEQIALGNQVKVLTLNKNFQNDELLLRQEIYDNISIMRIPFFGSKRYPLAFSCIRYLGDSDIVHIHCIDFFVDYLSCLRMFHRKKILVSTHGGYFHTKRFLWLKKIYFDLITRFIIKGCNKIIACSQNDYEAFSRLTHNIVKIDNGVDVKKFGKIVKNIESNTLVYIGRLDTHKRIDNLIMVTAVLLKNGVPVKLKIIGADWKATKEKSVKLATDLGIEKNVIFVGPVNEEGLLNELAKAHIFVSASEYEGFGISCVEAMASGTICVLNDIPVFRQFITNNENGFLVDFNNYNSAYKIIRKVITMDNNKYAEIAYKAKESIQKYSWPIVAKQISSVYKEILS